MKILITGASGYLGAFLSVELRSKFDIIRTSRQGSFDEEVIPLDIRDSVMVAKTFAALKPDVIIHTAAAANIGFCEKNLIEAFRTNTEGTLNIVRGANEVDAKVIFISSLAARDTLTVYGETKKIAENHIKTVKAGYEILQLSMTFGLSPNTKSHRPFNKILSALQMGTPQIFDKSWRFQPTYTEHLLSIINQVLLQSFKGRSLAITTMESCTMYQIASDLLNYPLVRGANLYHGRVEQIIELEHLSNFGFPTYSYSLMINQLRDQLANFHRLGEVLK